eukprot:5210769-Pyramimonas_sp.AAC.1
MARAVTLHALSGRGWLGAPSGCPTGANLISCQAAEALSGELAWMHPPGRHQGKHENSILFGNCWRRGVGGEKREMGGGRTGNQGANERNDE